MGTDNHEEPVRESDTRTSRDWGTPTALLGITALGWGIACILPLGLPAWPAASTATITLIVSRKGGSPLPRALGTFCAFIAITLGIVKIAMLYGILQLLG